MDAAGQAEFAVVICAAGSSSRMGGLKKEYRLLPAAPEETQRTVLAASVSAFAAIPEIGVIVITIPDGVESAAAAKQALPSELLERTNLLFAAGGTTRRASAHNALKQLVPYKPCYVLIHDGCRPWVSASLIRRVIAAVRKHPAVVPVLPLIETPKETEKPLELQDEDTFRDAPVFVTRHISRANIGGAQTPQAFAFPEILDAHESAASTEGASAAEFTDDAEVWDAFCGTVLAVPGAIENRKITFPEDLA